MRVKEIVSPASGDEAVAVAAVSYEARDTKAAEMQGQAAQSTQLFAVRSSAHLPENLVDALVVCGENRVWNLERADFPHIVKPRVVTLL